MPASLGVLLFAASAYTVTEDGYPLRRSCDNSSVVVAKLRQGEPVEIRFSIAGDAGQCYKVAATAAGQPVEGYVPAKALTGLDQFDRVRRQARGLDAPTEVKRDMDAVRKQVSVPNGTDERIRKAAQLLQANQPGEALTILEAAVKENRGDAGLLAMAGLAAYQSDQVASAVGYWRESLALAPNPPVDRLLKQAEREQSNDQSNEKLFGMRFLFRYDSAEVTPEQARSIVPVLDGEFARVSEQLGCRSEERIVAVIQSRDAYLRTTGAAEWSGGLYDGRIRVALLDGNQPGEQTRRAFAHEIVHACLARTGNWPAWLHEGLAQKLSGEPVNPAERAAVKQAARGGQLPSLNRLGHTYSRLSSRHAQLAYATAYLAADLLYEAYGADGVRNLLNSPDTLPQMVADLDRRLRE